MKYFILIYICAFGLVSNAQNYEEIKHLQLSNGQLEGALRLPDSLIFTSQKLPLALIIAGSGPTDRNGNNPLMTNNSLKMLAEGLAENGIASLRYDKRGVGTSKIDSLNEKNIRFKDFVSDASAWIAYLNKDQRFGSLAIIGHSEGALIGVLASQISEVQAYVSLAGVGTKAADIIREQLAAQPEFIQKISGTILDSLETGKIVAEVPLMLYALFRPSVQPYLISWFAVNPQEEIQKLKIPVLIIQGTQDIQVGTKESELLHSAKPDASKILINGMNHILKPAGLESSKNIATYNDPNIAIDPQLIIEIAHFVNSLQ